MKTPEEIKRGLECCLVDDEDNCVCEPCPYARCGSSTLTCDVEMGADVRSYIQQLEREKVNLLNLCEQFGQCAICKHTAKGTNESPCCDCWYCSGDAKGGSHWEWRGVEEDAK